MILGSCFMLNSFAQKPASAIFIELGGPGLASLNYDMRFQKKNDGLGFRIGVGGFGSEGVSLLAIPVGLNYLLGKDEKNYFELGAGFTYISVNNTDPFNQNNSDNFRSSFGHLNFGYRMAPKNGGFLFRAAINPVFGEGFFIPYYGAVAFGYKF